METEPVLSDAGEPRSEAPAPPSSDVRSRRQVLRWLGGLTLFSSIAMILTPVVGFLVPPKGGRAAGGGKILVGTTADIPPGGGAVVAMGSKPAIIVNTDQGVKAFSAICTHLGCVVAWNDMVGVIQCPCHDGRFDPNSGAVVSGPPPAPLPPLTVSVEGDQIFLTEA
ncbi:MAG TPA: Rieske (2Fe-2S) protein [Candidatus Limnocylindrales bacterium]|jgi:cytochrome b6-f complex iron-sulfur subunit